MDLKTTALKQNLQNGPGNVLPNNNKAPQLQAIGTKQPLDKTPSSVKYGANTPQGKISASGDMIKLNKTPQLGYQSANTPMSNRAVESKKVY